MTDFVTNDSYNLLPGQLSSLNCSSYFYKNVEGRKGSQTDYTFVGRRANFTSDMQGGLIQFASNEVGKSYNYSAMILEVVDSKTLTLSIKQELVDTDYIIWYGGVQFDQTGILSAKNIYLNGQELFPGLMNVKQTILTSLTSATYEIGENAKYMIVEGVGAGAGGGGVEAGPAACVGGGGGAGAYFRYLGPAEDFTYQCGAAGLGGNLTPGDNGSATTITAGISIPAISAGGGFGGSVGDGSRFILGGNGGVVSGAPLSLPGQSGHIGWTVINAETTDDYGISGRGANSFFGNGGVEIGASGTSSLDGANAVGYGAGGSGCIRTNSGAAPTGGNGGQGVILVTEYS